MIKMKILSPTGTVFDGNVAHVTFPGGAGSFSVYPLHAPIVSTLTKGNIVCYAPDGGKKTIPLQSGFVEVKDNGITVCMEQIPEQND
jgi:F-type H+-transporting ATPase subunit epsilon